MCRMVDYILKYYHKLAVLFRNQWNIPDLDQYAGKISIYFVYKIEA
jgi:hypothetical protein